MRVVNQFIFGLGSGPLSPLRGLALKGRESQASQSLALGLILNAASQVLG